MKSFSFTKQTLLSVAAVLSVTSVVWLEIFSGMDTP